MKNKTVEAVVGVMLIIVAVTGIILSMAHSVLISFLFSAIALVVGVAVVGWSMGGEQ